MKAAAIVSPQFEICYALGDLASPVPALDPSWAGIGAAEPRWLTEAKALGWAFWFAVPDILEAGPPPADLDDLFARLTAMSPDRARRSLLRGLFHSDGDPADVPAEKREWLAYVGLDDPANSAAATLRGGDSAFLDRMLRVLGAFRPVFEPLWTRLLPALERSRARVETLSRRASFTQLAERLRLPVEVAGHKVSALRGGYSQTVDAQTPVYLLPSVFNRRRFWSAADDGPETALFFPYLDATIPPPGRPTAGAEVDPWLICRALGDATRAAIVRRIAATPQTSAELGKALRLSKANISHHIFQLREAGLIDEAQAGRSIRLSLRRDTLALLSTALLREVGDRG